MTNEQLAALLSGIADEFSAALEAAELSLIGDRPKVREFQHLPPGICFNFNCQTPEHVREVMVDPPTPELDELRALLGRLEERIAIVRGYVPTT